MGVLPEHDEARAYTLTPDSVAWRVAGDARGMLAAGTALLLQVAHPTVGAGVHEHSNFEQDPWGRLLRTLDFVNLLVYGGADAAIATGRGTREIHKRIKGVHPDGTPYHSLEPEAYAWVHATLAETIVSARQRFVGRMSPGEIEVFWQEWRGLGRLLGVRDEDLPASWPEFRRYVDWMAHERLEHTPSVDAVLRTLRAPAPPPVPGLPAPAWKVLRMPAARATGLATVGLLPPVVREKLGLRWTRAMDAELRAIAAASRLVTPVAPKAVKCMGPAYLAWRGEALPVRRDGEPRTPRVAAAA